MSRRLALAIVAALLLTGTLAACGKRAMPLPPPGEKTEYPRTYPDPHDPQNAP